MYHQVHLGRSAILATVLLAFASTHAMAQSQQCQRVSPVGVWDLEGIDAADTKWIATVVLTKADGKGFAGHIDWLGSNGSCGREYVTASIDRNTRTLKMTGVKVVFSDNIVPANYTAELAPDGLHLANGKWSNEGVAIPGTWSARRIALR